MDLVPAIAILEDDDWRVTQMRSVIRESFPEHECKVIGDAPSFISWLEPNASRTRIVSLDCDLDMTASSENRDVGSGIEVAEHLAGQCEFCPILIHSSNAMRAPSMHMTLAIAGWSAVTLAPFEDAAKWQSDVMAALNRYNKEF